MPFYPKQKPQPSTISLKQLLKLEAQAEFDAVELELYRLQHNLCALWYENFKATHYAVVSNEGNQGHESKEVDFDLPPISNDYGEKENEEGSEEVLEDENEEESKEVLEEEDEEELEVESTEETQEEIIHADEGNMLELPLKGSKHLSLFLTPTKPTPTNQFGESLLPSPNSILTISLSPHLFLLMFKPLTKRKFCHKDKWKEPTLVL